MKTIRNSVFETNSSSIHSLSYELDDNLDLDENLTIELKYYGTENYAEYTSIKDKLAFISIALIENAGGEWDGGFRTVYAYLNGFETTITSDALKDFKKLLNDHGVKTVKFKWNETFGYECDDWFMEEIAEWLYADQENFLKHAIVIIEDRDVKYRREHGNY